MSSTVQHLCVPKRRPRKIHFFSPGKTRHLLGHPQVVVLGTLQDVDQRKDATFISLEKFETFAVEPPVVDLRRKIQEKPGVSGEIL